MSRPHERTRDRFARHRYEASIANATRFQADWIQGARLAAWAIEHGGVTNPLRPVPWGRGETHRPDTDALAAAVREGWLVPDGDVWRPGPVAPPSVR